MAGTRISTVELTPWPGDGDGASPEERVVPSSFAAPRRGAGAILDDGIALLVARFGPCVGVAALAWLPFELLRELVLDTEDVGPFLLFGLTQTLPEAFGLVAVATLLGPPLVGRELTPAGSLRLLLRSLPGVLLLVAPALTLANVMVCCFPLLFPAMSLVLVLPPVLVLESVPGGHGTVGFVHALRRANALVRDWSAFGRFLLWFLVTRMLFGALLGSVVGAWSYPQVREQVAGFLGTRGDGLQVLVVLVAAVLSGLTTALVGAVATVHYVDLRVRKEGVDLEVALATTEAAR